MTVAVAHMASTVLKAHPGFHMAAVEEAKLFGGVMLGEDADVVIKMRRDAPADGAGKLAVKCQILRKDGGRLQPVRRHPTRATPPAPASFPKRILALPWPSSRAIPPTRRANTPATHHMPCGGAN